MNTPSTSGHKRKISFADLSATFRRSAGPLYQPPHHPQQQQTPQQQQQAQLNAQQANQQQLNSIRFSDAARARAKVPTDRNVPEELSEVIVGDGVERYDRLRAVERKLDSVVVRKRLDVSDNMQRRYMRREGEMRVWISNTAEGQPWQVMEEGIGLGEDGTIDFGDASAATFRVKIEGRLADDPLHDLKVGEEDGGKNEEKAAKRPRLSHFFKSITIDFDRNPALQPDGYSAIEWRKPPEAPNSDPNSSEASFDTLEFERKGDENINITVSLVRDEKFERFKLSPQLAELLDTEEEDRAGAIQGIWDYCRVMGLHEDEDRRSIVCDDQLRKLFQQDKIYFPHVSGLLHAHLTPLPPIQLTYTIRVDKPYIDPSPPAIASEPTIYSLRVSLPNPLILRTQQFVQHPIHNVTLRSITSLDTDLALLVQKIHHTNAKRKFYENLAKDPAGFVRRWTGSQRRDLEVLLAEERNAGEGWEWRRGGTEGVWGTEGARESVGLWLARMGRT